MHNGHSHVLLVEDNPSDLRLTKEAFQDLDPLIRGVIDFWLTKAKLRS